MYLLLKFHGNGITITVSSGINIIYLDVRKSQLLKRKKSGKNMRTIKVIIYAIALMIIAFFIMKFFSKELFIVLHNLALRFRI